MSTKRKAPIPPKPKNTDDTILIDPVLTGRVGRRRKSVLDTELEAEDAMLAQELKSMRVDEIIMKRRARMKKLEKEIEDLEGSDPNRLKGRSPGISLQMARQIAKLPEEEREKVMQTFAIFRNIDDPVDRGSLLLPMLVGYAKTNPGSSQNDMATFAKALTDNFKAAVEITKASVPQQQQRGADSLELLKVFKDLVQESVRQPMQEVLRQLQPQPSAFEQILLKPELYQRAKEIGFFGSQKPAGGSTNVDLEIEKLRGERELSIKKLDLEWQKAMLERDAKETRTNQIINSLAPLSAIFAGPVDQRMRAMGRQSAAQNPNPQMYQAHQPTQQPPDNVMRIVCGNCGYEETRTFQGQPPPVIKCPKCEAELGVGAQ